VPTIVGPIAHTTHDAILFHELLYSRAHDELERRVALCLVHKEVQEARLTHRHRRRLPAQPALARRRDAAVREMQREIENRRVR
jgi:hypothetical protein